MGIKTSVDSNNTNQGSVSSYVNPSNSTQTEYYSTTTTTTTTTTLPINQGSNTPTTTVGGIKTNVDERFNSPSTESMVNSLEYRETPEEFLRCVDIYTDESNYKMMLAAYEQMREEDLKKIEKYKEALNHTAEEFYESVKDKNGDIDYSANNPLEYDAYLSGEIEKLESEILNINLAIQELNDKLSEIPYRKIRCMDEYEDFVSKYNKNLYKYEDIDDLYIHFNNGKIDPILIAELVKNRHIDTSKFDKNKLKNILNTYNYLSEDERNMYHYLYSVVSPDEAQKYLDTLEDEINRKIGLANAQDKINSINLDDPNAIETVLNNYFVAGHGLKDGVVSFFEGLDNIVNADGKVSVSDYEKMFFLQLLSEKSESLPTKFLPFIYKFSSSAGNMIPSITASTVASIVLSPAAGEVVGSLLMGASAGGNAQEQALQMGANADEALLYGILTGASEAVLEHFLGGIPGLSKNASSGIISHMRKEGQEEFIQEILDAFLQEKLLNKKIDNDELMKNGLEAYLMGALMGGMFSGINTVANEVKLILDGKDYEISTEDLMSFLNSEEEINVQNLLEYKSEDGSLALHAPAPDINYAYYYNGELQKVSSAQLAKVFESQVMSERFAQRFWSDAELQALLPVFQRYYVNNYFGLSSEEKTNFFTMCKNIDYTSNVSAFFGLPEMSKFEAYLRIPEAYSKYLDSLNRKSPQQQMYELANFHQELQEAINSGVLLPPYMLNQLLRIDNVYLGTQNNIVEQHCVQKVIAGGTKSERYQQIFDIAKKNFPDFSNRNIKQLLSIIDTKGVCTYATVVNEIVDHYKGSPGKFKEDFGFDLYYYDSMGVRHINDAMIITDLFCFCNKDNSKITDKGLINLKAKDDSGQNYLHSNPDLVDAYLKTKNPSLGYNEIYIHNGYGNPNLSVEEEIANIKYYLERGDNVELGVYAVADNPMPMYYRDGTLAENLPGGHSMSLIGFDANGNIIVDSHHKKEPLIIKWEDLKKYKYLVGVDVIIKQ